MAGPDFSRFGTRVDQSNAPDFSGFGTRADDAEPQRERRPRFGHLGTLVEESDAQPPEDAAPKPRGRFADHGTLVDRFAAFGTLVEDKPAKRPLSEFSLDQPAEETGLLEDVGRSLVKGVVRAGAHALSAGSLPGEVAMRTPGFGHALRIIDREIKSAFGIPSVSDVQRSLSSIAESIGGGQSSEVREALRKDWWDEKNHWFGPAWSDWRSYAFGLVESLPEEVLTIFPAMRLAKGAYAAKLAAGAGEEVAARAAARTAMLTGGFLEGSLQGGASAMEVRERILKMPESVLAQSDAMKQLMAQGYSFDDARAQLANDASTRALFMAGITTGIFGGLGDRILARAITGKAGGLTSRIAKGAVGEGLLEEFPQGYTAKIAENLALRAANPNQPLTAGALNEAFGGLAIGSLQGGAQTAIFGRGPRPERTDDQPLPADEVLGRGATPPAGALPAPRTPLLPAPKPEIHVDSAGAARVVSPDEAALKESGRAEMASYGNTSPNAVRTDIEELRRLEAEQQALEARIAQAEAGRDQRAADIARVELEALEQKRETIERAYTERDETKAAQLDEMAREHANARGDTEIARAQAAEAPRTPTAIELAMQRAGIKPRTSATTDDQQLAQTVSKPAEKSPMTELARRHATAAQGDDMARVIEREARALGYPDMPTRTLEHLLANGSPETRRAADAELERRAAARVAGPSEQDHAWIRKLLDREPLTQTEHRRAIALGFIAKRPGAKWAITGAAHGYHTKIYEGRELSDQALVDRLNAVTGRRLRIAADVPTDEASRAGLGVARSFGKRVVWVDDPEMRINGLVVPEDPNTIFINAWSTHSHLAVLGHELLHTLRRTNEEVYSELLARLKPLMTDVPEYRAWLQRSLGRDGATLSKAELDDLTNEELIADLFGDQMLSAKFWTEVFKGQPRSWVEKLRDAIALALEAIRIRLLIGGRRGFGSEKYVKDVEAAQRALMEAFNAWARHAERENAAGRPSTPIALASRERRTLAEDVEPQSRWLTDRAHELGYSTVDDLAAKAPAEFDRLAAQWRTEHPAEALYSRTRPGFQVEPKLELEKALNGDWLSPDGRYEITRDPNGYYAMVGGEEIGSGRDFQQARQLLLDAFKADIAAGRVGGGAPKSVLQRYTSQQQRTVVEVWKHIAALPGAFRFGRSHATNMRDIARDLGVDDVLSNLEERGQGTTGGTAELTFIDGTRARIHWDDANNTAHVDATNMQQRGFGAQLYQLALTWAANNKRTFIPDPGGLSFINTFRRTEQMLSAALRLGTTKYMRPHPDQGLDGWINEANTRSDDEKNVAILLLSSYENIMQDGGRKSALQSLRYNFDRARFEDEHGNEVPKEHWLDLAESEQSRAVGGGLTTLQRAVLTQSVLREVGERSGDELAALVQDVPTFTLLDAGYSLGGILYSRRRDSGSGPVAGPARGGAGASVRGAALGAARAAVAAGRPVAAALDVASRGIETVAKIPGKLLAPITSRIYDRVVGTGQWLAQKSPFVQEIAHGVIADYGLPEPYLQARSERDSRVQAALRRSKHLIDQIAALERSEARVAYLWMQEKPDTQEEQRLLAQLPESSRQTLAAMKEQIDQLGREAVRLGLLSQDSYERNKMAYLHRTYKKHELEAPYVAARGQHAKAIRAEAYRGRGLRDDVAASRVPGVMQGARFARLEDREAGEAGAPGRLKRVVYVKASDPIPAAYSGWRRDGVWEARWFDRPGRVGMWRDLTTEERQRLGEIDEVRYAFARTMLASTRDIEMARFLDWVASTHSREDEEAVTDAGGRVVKAVDQATTLKVYADDQWVQVPDGFAEGTKIKKYGALAGRYVPGHIWNDIRSTVNFRAASAVGRLYDELLRAWKISKTGLSLAVHTNNVMSNFILADMADVGFEDIRVALRTIIEAQGGDEAAKVMMARYYDSGAELGSQVAIELRGEVIEPILKGLASEQDEALRTASILQALSLSSRAGLRERLAVLAGSRGAQMAAAPFKAMIDLYRQEDSVFRLAKFMKETEGGMSDADAGRAARKAFLDYSINAPWVQALRRGPFPFLAFSYRAIPLLIEAAAKKPWKVMKYFAVGYALNALAYAMLGAAGDEDKERKLLPPEKSGRVLGVTHRMMRMPWNDEHGSPVFLDIRRWVPGGDLVDLAGSQGALSLPEWLSIGGPLSLLIELAANKSLFTGRPIVKSTDTPSEQLVKLIDHVYKFFIPNLPVPNPLGPLADDAMNRRGLFQTYSWRAVSEAAGGATDASGREKNLAHALASSVGVKLSARHEDLARRQAAKRRDAALREISGETREMRRDYIREFGAELQRDRQKREEALREKRAAVLRRYAETVGLERIPQ